MMKINIPEKYIGTEIEDLVEQMVLMLKLPGALILPVLPESEEQFTVEVVADGS